MADQDFLGRGWAYPVNLQGRAISVAEGEALIRQSIMIILGTAKGERVMRPDFGSDLNQLVFRSNDTATTALITLYTKDALLQWEPRIEVLDVAVTADGTEDNRLNIAIEYRIKSLNTKHNLVYPFYLERVGR
ncbi:MAG TPA: GPW/gp25 family protein [Bacillota bacterium]|nr:GPW/gp25 family protein [Bacillota bacterium]